MNSWLNANFRKAVAATGRKKFVIAGLWTEACVMFPTLDMLKEGYEIYIPADACGDLSLEAHNRSMDRAVQAGAVPITSAQYVFELQQDWARTGNLRRRHGHPAGAFALRHPGPLLEMGTGRARLGGRSQGRRNSLFLCNQERSDEDLSVVGLGAGLLVGIIYSLLNVRSPAPPLVALVGLLGILVGEQVIPVEQADDDGQAAWPPPGEQAKCAPHMFGMLPGRQAEEAATDPRNAEEKGVMSNARISFFIAVYSRRSTARIRPPVRSPSRTASSRRSVTTKI